MIVSLIANIRIPVNRNEAEYSIVKIVPFPTALCYGKDESERIDYREQSLRDARAFRLGGMSFLMKNPQPQAAGDSRKRMVKIFTDVE